MSRRILVPVDESERATDALEFALEEHSEATIVAIHVLDPADLYGATGFEGGAMINYDEIHRQNQERGEALLENAADRAAEQGIECEIEVIIGSVARSIVDYADNNPIDQIVIGSHGRTGASRILLGSVAETVARRSPVPVTIVR
ncbi:universal stress protein [Natrialbaceae archaeon A-CW3]